MGNFDNTGNQARLVICHDSPIEVHVDIYHGDDEDIQTIIVDTEEGDGPKQTIVPYMNFDNAVKDAGVFSADEMWVVVFGAGAVSGGLMVTAIFGLWTIFF